MKVDNENRVHASEDTIKSIFSLNGLDNVSEASILRTTSDVSSLLENLQELWDMALGEIPPLPVFRLAKWNE